MKLRVRRDQLLAKSKPEIQEQKANTMKRYLRCIAYSLGNKYEAIKQFGGIT